MTATTRGSGGDDTGGNDPGQTATSVTPTPSGDDGSGTVADNGTSGAHGGTTGAVDDMASDSSTGPGFCEQADCVDDDPCTADGCDAQAQRCVHELAVGAVCDDNDECTANDVCQPDGTCGGEPACPIEHCGMILGNEVWGPGPPHVLTCPVNVGGPQVPTLTILDGTVVQAQAGAGLYIGYTSSPGQLDVQGGTEGVLFTSASDDPAPGDWAGISLGTAGTVSSIVGATVEYAGQWGLAAVGVGVQGPLVSSTLTISDSVIRYNALSGLAVSVDAELAVLGCDVHDNGDDGIQVLQGGTLEMHDTNVTDNAGDGVYIDGVDFSSLGGAPAPFTGNVLTGNAGAPVNTGADQLRFLDASSSFAGNGEMIRAHGYVFHSGTWVPLDENLDITSLALAPDPWTTCSPPTLEIEAGVTLYVSNLNTEDDPICPGSLVTSGTADDPVHIIVDNELDLQGVGPVPNQLTHTIVEGGHRIWAHGTPLVLDHATIRQMSPAPSQAALWIETGGETLAMTDSVVEDNTGLGMFLNAPVSAFSNNTMTGNGIPLRVDLYRVSSTSVFETSSFTGNDDDVVEIGGAPLNDLEIAPLEVPYRVVGDFDVGIWNDVTLTIDPGVTLLFEPGIVLESLGATYGHSSALNIVGQPAQPIVLSSAATTPAPGDWGGVLFDPGSTTSVLDNVAIEYAGGGNGAVVVQEDGLTISNSTISDSASWGVYQDGATATLSGNTYSSNALGDVYP